MMVTGRKSEGFFSDSAAVRCEHALDFASKAWICSGNGIEKGREVA